MARVKSPFPYLLYHHVILENPNQSRYAVDVGQFQAEMQFLKDQGYQTISVNDMVEAVYSGKTLPAKSIIITFDDGNQDIFQNAYPIMQSYGFRATMYLIAADINANTFLTKEMVQEMSQSGWEFGSHSMTHPDLSKTDNEMYEICTSRTTLMNELNLPIQSFAYPYGVATDAIKHLVSDCGYSSGAGLGMWIKQSPYNIFYFYRREVQGNFSIDNFSTLLVNHE